MNFHLQNKKKKKSLSKKILLGFVSLVFGIFIINFTTGGSLSNAINTPATTLWGVGSLVERAVESVRNIVVSKEALLEERNLLKMRVRDLELYALNNLVLVSENIELQKLLGSANLSENVGILARVFASGGLFPYGTMVISHESETKFAIGSLVFGAQNVVIGLVSENYSESSLVTLLSASERETQVLIGTGERVTQASIKGIGNGNMIAKMPRDVDIRVDDPVVLFADQTALVGFIGDIEMQPTDAFQLIKVRIPLNLATIRFVRVR